MAQFTKRFMKQKFIALLIILLSTIALLVFGFITPIVFQTVMLWSFAVFAGADTLDLGTVQIKDFMIQKEVIARESSKQIRES